ncbi:hypothetical protein ACB094_05G186900 [Castanea mollissima]
MLVPQLIPCDELLLFLLSAILIPIQASALLPYLFPPTCNNNSGNYTSNSTYKTNLNQVLSSLYSNTTIDYGFYYSSYGQNPDKVYAIGLCRGDVNPDDCRGCLKNSSTLLTQDCPNKKEAVGCSIFGIMDTSFHILVCDMQNVFANYLAQFNDDVNILLNNLKTEAAAGASLCKYAAGSAITTDFKKIYALVQCTPDLLEQTALIAYFPLLQLFQIIVLGRWLHHQPIPPLVYVCGNLSNTLRTVIIVVVASVAFVVLIVSIYICVYLRESSPREKAAEISGTLYNGQDVAVKRFSRNSGQGDLEFKNEVLLVAKVQHRNLVRLRFVPNTSLDHFLFDYIKCVHLNWENRYKIIGVSNIFSDEEMNAKISDFGMAKFGCMALECIMHGQFSVKSDVFSFGMLVLEIVNGQRNNCVRNGENVEDLLSYAWKNWREGNASHIIDPTLRHSSTIEIMRCIHIGLLCVQENVIDRPTMGLIVLMLNRYSITFLVPSQPAFFMHNNIESDMSSNSEHNLEVTKSNHSKGHYVQHSANEASITELYPH